MHASDGGIRDTLQRLLAPPDQVMRRLGAGSERLVARVRLLLSVLALALPLFAAATGAGMGGILACLGAVVLANAVALAWLVLARQERSWLPFATCTWDTSLVTATLVAIALRDPSAATTGVAAWSCYLLVILSAALRADGRLALYTGGLALLQYGLFALAAYLGRTPPEAALALQPVATRIGAEALRMLLLVLATGLAAVAVRRMQALVETSGHDALTGLPNRSWLVQRMPHVFANARNSGASLTLVLLDVDRFKRVNDEAGPQAGDRALRHIASTMSEMLADTESLARIGGQEFVMLLHGPAGSAWERLDRLRRTLVERPFLPERGQDAFVFTFSAGLAAWPQDGSSTSSLLGCADRRLKSAKAAGGNRIVARDP
ncbi:MULTISPECIES: GGDEF domain-containing protein [unclassified Luteimonas]|uniref:GGDEF domain-containing protein n=1 Tax=unclassified Luteimonas TaxID=2629088 RepID=UPI0018F087B9|nr:MULTISPECIES: GGDEF domain-containing protein [unclassified Luteimonas]MBJ6978624.1 GGDEF domain-containing protein [Luteimonas sp. MC1895]MBJ6983521.1 GGDEF domain-containing protein [Luteimonas sp. MC1750]QQO06368.1 GGDEF domain-containing protein [Luteimonas sp. MC1750]